MTIFVDASALVAILNEEAGYEDLAGRLDADPVRVTSAIAYWEAAQGLSRAQDRGLAAATIDLRAFVSARGITFIEVTEREGLVALQASQDYGKGRHRARLNMGDCFAYACAKTNQAQLLYKGDDFIHTDLA